MIRSIVLGALWVFHRLRVLAREGVGCHGLVIDGERHDAGDKLGYLRANLSWALKRPDLAPGLVAVMRELLERHKS